MLWSCPCPSTVYLGCQGACAMPLRDASASLSLCCRVCLFAASKVVIICCRIQWCSRPTGLLFTFLSHTSLVTHTCTTLSELARRPRPTCLQVSFRHGIVEGHKAKRDSCLFFLWSLHLENTWTFFEGSEKILKSASLSTLSGKFVEGCFLVATHPRPCYMSGLF